MIHHVNKCENIVSKTKLVYRFQTKIKIKIKMKHYSVEV